MPRSVYQLRFLLQQPSPIWKDFSIVHVKMSQSTVAAKDVGDTRSIFFYECVDEKFSVLFSVNYRSNDYWPAL